MAVQVLSGKVFLVVTGASQGIGQQIAVTFSHLLDKKSEILLMARNLEGLKSTVSKVPKDLKVHCESVDLSVATADVLNGIVQKCLGPDGVKKFDRAVIVHNAASIGDLKKSTVDLFDFEELRKYYDLNVSAPAVLNSVLMKLFNGESKIPSLVINISSHAAISPMRFAALYCSGKAARAMYFKVFALEFPEVNVLNYSPGPVETELFNTLVTTIGDEEISTQMAEKRKRNEVLTTKQTVDKLVEVLREQKYKSATFDMMFRRSTSFTRARGRDR